MRDTLETQAIAEILGDAPLLTHATIEAIASRLRAECPHGSAEAFASFLGLHVVVASLPAGLDAVLCDNTILVRRSRNAARSALLVLHECAHHLLRDCAHSHGDAWALTLALARPLRVPQAATIAIPEWANSAREKARRFFLDVLSSAE